MAHKDPEKRKAYNKAYREAHKEELKAGGKAYREAHKEKTKAYSKAYNEAHKEKLKAHNKKQVEECSDSYIAGLLRVPVSTIPADILELKRQTVKLNREVRQWRKNHQ